MRRMERIISWFERSLDEHPVLTRVVLFGVLALVVIWLGAAALGADWVCEDCQRGDYSPI